MNPYSQLLDSALEEIEEFSRTDEGVEWEIKWYKRIMELVAKASREIDHERAEELMDMVSWCIVDSGPQVLAFAPSLNAAQEALVKARRQREIEKHKRPNKVKSFACGSLGRSTLRTSSGMASPFLPKLVLHVERPLP
ncbi:MAG: hypothetical protein ABW087_21180 [Candidatus Thiodiazotropha sp.]